MKRILYSCIFLISFLIINTIKAQQGSFSITPQFQCYNASNSYTAEAAVVAQAPGSTSYSWTVVSAAGGGTCTPTFTSSNPLANPSNTSINITFPCCGQYTVTCSAYANGVFTSTLQLAFAPPNTPGVGQIYCQTGAGITPTAQSICIGNSATITPVIGPGATYTWSNGSNATQLVVTPSVNTCYTYTATTAQGCTVTPIAPACVTVQAITYTVSPSTQSMCANGQVSFTANATAVSNASVGAGTSITGYQWYSPLNPPPFGPAISAAPTATDIYAGFPNPSVYEVIITHTGTAGTCTLAGTSTVVLSNSISVSLIPSSPSVCPSGAITLTAVSQQTTATTNFTWTISDNGAPPVVQPTNGITLPLTGVNPVTTVTVDVDYFGCPGQATTTIGLLTLTPTLTSSAPATCPGQSLTLTAKGAVSYTFHGYPVANPTATFALTNATSSTAIHTPLASDLPVMYCITADSTGCAGSTCTMVTTMTLTPTLSVSAIPGVYTNSICPATPFTLTAGGSGTFGSAETYTFSAPYSANIGTTNPQPHTATGANTLLPQTYTVVVDSAGCQGKAQITVNPLALTPTLVSTAFSNSICAGQTVTLSVSGGTGTTYTFSATDPSFGAPGGTVTLVDAGTANTIEHTPPATATLITYTVVADSLNCRGTATHTIGILDLGPMLLLSSVPSGSVCPGNTLVVSAVGATMSTTGSTSYTFTGAVPNQSYTATAPNATTSVSSGTLSVPPLPFPAGGVIYTVQAKSNLGCVGTQTIAIQEYSLNPTITLSSTLACRGTSVVISAGNITPPNTPGATSYTFFASAPPGSPPVSFTSTPGSFSVTQNPTVQTVYSVLAENAGCKTYIAPTATVDIRPDLALIPSTTAASVCPGLPATLSVSGPTAATSISFTWAPPSSGTMAPNPANDTPSVTVYPILNTTYTVNALDSLGCVGSTVITVGIDPALSYSIGLSSSGSTICAGQFVTLTASTSLSFPSVPVFSWSPSIGVTNPTPTITASPSVTTIYTVSSNNGHGCFAQNTFTVPVGQYPQITIASSSGSVCPGFTSTLTAFGANSFTWTGSTFSTAIPQQSVSVVPGQYTVLGSNGGGCTNTKTINIGLGQPLNILVTQSSHTTCIANNAPKFSHPVHLTASGAATYVWFPYNPLHMTYSLGAQTDVRPPATTQYTVIGSTTDCSGQQTVQVTVIPQFTFNVITPDPAICLGDSIGLSIVNIGTLAAGPVSALTYSWTEPLNAPPISMTAYLTPTVTVFPQNTSTYSVEVKDSKACVSFPKLVTVTVLPRPVTSIAIPTINNVPTNTVCFVGLNPGALDVTLNLTANNTTQGLPFGIVPSYTWISPYAPPYNSILTPNQSNAVIINAPTRVLNNSSVVVYTVISGYANRTGCREVDTVSIRIVDCRPVYSATFTTAERNDTICARSCITYINQSDTMSGGPHTYSWTFRGGSPATSTLANPTVCYNFPNPKGYDVILRVSNPYPLINPTGVAPGSTLALGVVAYVRVVDVPNVTIISPGQMRSDTIIRFGQSLQLKGSGAYTYEWSPGYNISSLTKPNVTVNPFKTTQYILTGYNSKQCSSSDTLNVIIVEDCGEMYVPNAFTPNNDGANDVLYVRGLCLQSMTFMVFNRWGEKVFETADQKNGWDGTYKGEALNTGVFVYRLEGKTYDGKGFSAKGNITLIR